MTLTIEDIAKTKNLLVVSDFDGTIAGFSKDAYSVPINQKSLKAVKDLSQQANTEVVILSGRHLEGLRKVLDLGQYRITMVGSHGSEDSSRPRSLTPEEEARLDRIHADLEAIVDGIDGAFVEVKPFHRVLHFIRVSDKNQVQAILDQAATVDSSGLKVTKGKNIIEYSISSTTKGTWLKDFVSRTDPTGIIFIGDDTTDEHGFEALENDERALTIKVGAGDTAAKTRVDGVDDVGILLEKLAYHRMQYVETTRLGL
ncbi:trehalose-6-phosphate phosphatase [Corynebacterium suranareeae]|uniref:Trehalose 6-phosphate phosphatase n=1 Tax=Corynebacterium suranareeae TaxID=2506452 RepID=A0A160PT63_9CORY|nr:trehalose-phosphatase [Corynebacterium suranareeae]BAU96974.1 trehalose-6-phosphate phosphatase [Corynebacterium suranareeae]